MAKMMNLGCRNMLAPMEEYCIHKKESYLLRHQSKFNRKFHLVLLLSALSEKAIKEKSLVSSKADKKPKTKCACALRTRQCLKDWYFSIIS
jgi:hypothetical protein